MKNIVQFILIGLIVFNSCASFKNLKYESIPTLSKLDGTYVDTIGNFNTDSRVSYGLDYIMERDTADIYKIQFVDNKHLKVFTLTDQGFQESKTYKGKYNKKRNYFERSIKKRILPFVVLTSYLNIKERIGKNENEDLLIDYRYESFGILVPFGASNYDYQTTSNLVKLEKIELIPTKIGIKFGYTNPQGDILIEPKYDFARVFKNNVARVKVNNKWGLIDKKGNYIFEPQFDYISNLYNDSIAYVRSGKHVGLINKNGTEILPVKELEIDMFSSLGSSQYKVYKGKKEGIYDSMIKKYIVEPIYDDIKIEHPIEDKTLGGNRIEPYFILSSNKEKSIVVNDTLVIPQTAKMNVYKIYSLFPYIDYYECENEPDKIYALKIDFSETSITLGDIYPFYLKINGKFYVLDQKQNYYELFREKETFKSVLLLKQPRLYIENKPLTYDEITKVLR